MTLRLKVAVLAASVAVALGGCSAGSSTQGGSAGASAGAGSTTNQSLSVGLVAEPASLDFTKTDGAAIPQVLLYNVYETLVKVNNEGKLVPGLAKEWQTSEDRKTYTFTLVEGATFTNGKKFTAEDAKFSIDRVKSDWTVSLKKAMDVVKSVEAPSPTELKVTLSRPSNQWLYRMTTRIGAMFSKDGVSALATDPVGTGPYDVQKWTRGDSITLARNEKYWGTKPYFATVTMKYFKDPTALMNAMRSGTINVVSTVQTPESLGQFENNDKYQVIEGTTNGEVVLSFNNGAGPLKDKRLRQAVRAAIDHKALLKTCWAGRGQLIGSMVPPTDPWYEDLTDLAPYDQAKAKDLIKATGKPAPTLRLRIPALPYAVSCGTVVKSQLEQVGFTVKLDQLEFPAAWLKSVFTNADYDMSIVAHVEPRDMATVFGDPTYYTRYGTPQIQELFTKADEGSTEDQTTYLKEAARVLSKDAAGDWLFLLPNLMVADKNITGLPKNAITESFDLTGLGRS